MTLISRPWRRLGRAGGVPRVARGVRRRNVLSALIRVGLRSGHATGAEDETLDAIKDHNEIRDAITEVARYEVGTLAWRTAIARVNRANGDHMAEEEREGLTDFRLIASLGLRHDLAVQVRRLRSAQLRACATDRSRSEELRTRGRTLAGPRVVGRGVTMSSLGRGLSTDFSRMPTTPTRAISIPRAMNELFEFCRLGTRARAGRLNRALRLRPRDDRSELYRD